MASDDAAAADDDGNEGAVNEFAEGKRYDASGPTDCNALDNFTRSCDESETHSDIAHQTDVEGFAEEVDIHDRSPRTAKMEEGDDDDDRTLRPSPLREEVRFSH